jgi:hypothetical protein
MPKMLTTSTTITILKDESSVLIGTLAVPQKMISEDPVKMTDATPVTIVATFVVMTDAMFVAHLCGIAHLCGVVLPCVINHLVEMRALKNTVR